MKDLDTRAEELARELVTQLAPQYANMALTSKRFTTGVQIIRRHFVFLLHDVLDRVVKPEPRNEETIERFAGYLKQVVKHGEL